MHNHHVEGCLKFDFPVSLESLQGIKASTNRTIEYVPTAFTFFLAMLNIVCQDSRVKMGRRSSSKGLADMTLSTDSKEDVQVIRCTGLCKSYNIRSHTLRA